MRPPHPRPSIDRDSAERLLGAGVAGDDAPPGFAGVARLLRAAAAPAPAPADERAGEARTVAAMAATVALETSPSHPLRRSTVFTRLLTAKVAAAAITGGLTLTSGLAVANALPGPAQNVASDALAHIGISAPHPGEVDKPEAPEADTPEAPETEVAHNEAADNGAGTNEVGGHDHGGTTTTTVSGTEKHGDNHGATVSDLAHSTDATGRDKGAAVSGVASDGRSHRGDDHPGGDDHPTTTTTTVGSGPGAGTGTGAGAVTDDGSGHDASGHDASGDTGHDASGHDASGHDGANHH